MSQVQVAGLNTIGAVDAWMKVISANVTGAVVNGYKGSQVQFSQVLETMTRGAIKPTDGYGSVNAISAPDSGIHISSTTTDFTQGTIQQTGEATNLAVNGDAFFVLSRVPVPRTMDDIVFTRNGDFHFEFIKGTIRDENGKLIPGVGTFRLVNRDGLFVQGYNIPIIDNVRPPGHAPEENQGTERDSLDLNTIPDKQGDKPRQVQLQNIQVDLARNPEATNQFNFNNQGLLSIRGDDPIDLAGNKANMFIGLVKFANNDGLKRQGDANFQYDLVAGEMFAGVAGTGEPIPGKVVGSTNVIVPQSIENSNTSINTTIPEITLAQKSFTAATKVISVGNSMIDDVDQLVK